MQKVMIKYYFLSIFLAYIKEKYYLCSENRIINNYTNTI